MQKTEAALELLADAIISTKLHYAKKFSNAHTQESALDIWFEMKALQSIDRQIKIEIEAITHATSRK